ncbi:hypothetical protein ACIPY5_08360 [Microbacterium sp. NPDC089698]|uniref:hypothetical protein n=1 Tax=Microbacterium sp. NPDC089698 TaxID=3364200 RepID=UPI0038019BDE
MLTTLRKRRQPTMALAVSALLCALTATAGCAPQPVKRDDRPLVAQKISEYTDRLTQLHLIDGAEKPSFSACSNGQGYLHSWTVRIIPPTGATDTEITFLVLNDAQSKDSPLQLDNHKEIPSGAGDAPIVFFNTSDGRTTLALTVRSSRTIQITGNVAC